MPTIPLRRGDTFVASAAFSANGVAKDMSGYTLEADLQFANCTPVPLTAAWVTIATGIASIRLPHADTATLQPGEHQLRVRAINAAGDRSSCSPITVQVS